MRRTSTENGLSSSLRKITSKSGSTDPLQRQRPPPTPFSGRNMLPKGYADEGQPLTPDYYHHPIPPFRHSSTPPHPLQPPSSSVPI
ncbi:hypothetical protein PoB_007194600 [Plakobranchus ocellatus]|uniref:Uncharacterized protein n=1 Tax=Plakobranchus ocellatus TaxID=259542 RepID=A0AAV4DMS5_9GAST|nr:hypothetical protein PoB_007194600 [Plakobranchus ocellatus]